MKQNHHTSPPACDRSEEIRREAERAIRECDTAADLTDRILSQPIADRLAFIDRAEAYYTRLLSLRQREALVDHFDQREPKFGDLTDYFRSHREEARRELPKPSYLTPADAVRRIALQKKASEPKQTTTNTPINMTINNYGGTQNIFEAGATQHIERLICTSAPEQVSLPQEEGTSTPAELAATVNNQKQPGQEEEFTQKGQTPLCKNEQEEQGTGVRSGEPIFRYISPFVTDEQERLRIHAVVRNIVSGAFPMPYICAQLKLLVREQKIALNVSHEDQFGELVRLGLPAGKKGFTMQNYKNYI